MIEFIFSYGSDIILSLIVVVFLLTVWVARKLICNRKPCPEKQRKIRHQEVTKSLRYKMQEMERTGSHKPLKGVPSISVKVLDVDLEKVDLEATIASYWAGQS